MTEEELLFCTLCGPLQDAVELIDKGQLDTAKALLCRILKQAQNMLEEDD